MENTGVIMPCKVKKGGHHYNKCDACRYILINKIHTLVDVTGVSQ